jgi:hypothetical protein
LILWIDSTSLNAPIRSESMDSNFICELLSRWRHGLPCHPIWLGLCLGGRWSGQEPHQSVTLASICVGTKHFLCLLKIPENCWNFTNSYLMHFNSEKYKQYIKMFRKT